MLGCLDLFDELLDKGCIMRPICIASGSFADSPKSTEIRLSVRIDAETEKNSYILEFQHSERGDGILPVVITDKTEQFKRLEKAVFRFDEVNNVVYNVIRRKELQKKAVGTRGDF